MWRFHRRSQHAAARPGTRKHSHQTGRDRTTSWALLTKGWHQTDCDWLEVAKKNCTRISLPSSDISSGLSANAPLVHNSWASGFIHIRLWHPSVVLVGSKGSPNISQCHDWRRLGSKKNRRSFQNSGIDCSIFRRWLGLIKACGYMWATSCSSLLVKRHRLWSLSRATWVGWDGLFGGRGDELVLDDEVEIGVSALSCGAFCIHWSGMERKVRSKVSRNGMEIPLLACSTSSRSLDKSHTYKNAQKAADTDSLPVTPLNSLIRSNLPWDGTLYTSCGTWTVLDDRGLWDVVSCIFGV